MDGTKSTVLMHRIYCASAKHVENHLSPVSPSRFTARSNASTMTVNMGTEVLMTICVALRLKLRIVEQIFAKSNNKLNYYQDPDKTYIRILENMPGLSLQDFNSVLVQAGIKELGSTLKDDPS